MTMVHESRMKEIVKPSPSLDTSLAVTIDDEDVYLEDLTPQPLVRQLSGAKPPVSDGKKKVASIVVATDWKESDLDRQYDLTPVEKVKIRPPNTPSYSIDPWEVNHGAEEASLASTSARSREGHKEVVIDGNAGMKSTFIIPSDIHPNMESKEEEIARLRLLAGKLSADWRTQEFMPPALARRIRDFQFAQEKRRKKHGDERPWGILGLYDHLSSIRIDVEWAEDAARRRANGEPYMSWVDFDESKRVSSNRPYFVLSVLFVCTIVMVASIAANGWRVEKLTTNIMIGPSAATLIRMGAKDTNLIVNHGEGWRLLTSTVLHAGLVHYVVNMLALWFVGVAIETNHGWVATMIIFTLSAVGGTILSAIFLPQYITVGASGGIFGLIGACLADIILNWKLLFCDFVTENGKKHRHVIVVVVLLLDIALNSIIGLTPFVDNFTHLGGMTYGLLCGICTIERLSTDFFGMEEGWMSQTKHFFVRFFGVILSVVAFVATLIVLMHGDGLTTPCPSCTWLSCVPFPPWEDNTHKWWYCDDCGRVTAQITEKPNLQLELNCPSGGIARIGLTQAESLNRGYLKRKLPSLCRQYCPSAHRGN